MMIGFPLRAAYADIESASDDSELPVAKNTLLDFPISSAIAIEVSVRLIPS